MFDNNGSFLLATLEFFIFFAWFMSLFWIFGDLFRSRDLGGFAKTLWSLFLIILPILGMLIYLIVRGHGMSERALDAQAEAQTRQDEYIRKVAASNGGNQRQRGRQDRVGEGLARLRCHQRQRIRAAEGRGARGTRSASPVAQKAAR